jgi:hypothetical protein
MLKILWLFNYWERLYFYCRCCKISNKPTTRLNNQFHNNLTEDEVVRLLSQENREQPTFLQMAKPNVTRGTMSKFNYS